MVKYREFFLFSNNKFYFQYRSPEGVSVFGYYFFLLVDYFKKVAPPEMLFCQQKF